METLKKIAVFVFIGSLLVACKKEELPQNTVSGAPSFAFTGTIGNANLNLQSGVNNYYMYSSDTQNVVTGIYGFTGRLQNISTNKNSIQITINDYKTSPANIPITSAHADSAFSPTISYFYTAHTDTTYSVKFTPVIYKGTPSTYLWNFGNGTSASASPTFTYTTAGIYNTSLKITFADHSHKTILNPITIVKNQPQLWIDSLHSTIDSISQYSARATYVATVSNGISPYTYSWSFGDGDSASFVSANTTYTVNHTYFDSASAIFSVNLKVTDHSGISQNYNYSFYNDTLSTYPGDLFDYKMSQPVRNINSNLPLSDVTIVYTDVNGNVYISNNTSQPGSSNFQVLSVSDYQNNQNNQPTKLLKVSFNCTLYPVAGGAPILASNCTATIAVAY